MDAKQIAQAPVSGMRGKVVERLQRPVAERTPFTVEQIRSAFGAVFLLLALRTVFRAVRAAARS